MTKSLTLETWVLIFTSKNPILTKNLEVKVVFKNLEI